MVMCDQFHRILIAFLSQGQLIIQLCTPECPVVLMLPFIFRSKMTSSLSRAVILLPRRRIAMGSGARLTSSGSTNRDDCDSFPGV